MGLIDAEKTGVNVKYSLNDADAIRLILSLTSDTKLVATSSSCGAFNEVS